WGLICDTAASGTQGLALLRAAVEDGRPYDVALVDLVMPEMDGWALAAAIKRDPDIASTPLVLLTPPRQSDPEELRRAGFAAALARPRAAPDLIPALARVAQGVAGAPAKSGAEPFRPAEPPALLRTPPILVVEDNAINQMVALGLLKGLGYRADGVGNGLEAL